MNSRRPIPFFNPPTPRFLRIPQVKIHLPDYGGTQARFPDDEIIGTRPTGRHEHFTQESVYRPALRTEAELRAHYESCWGGVPPEFEELIDKARAVNGKIALANSLVRMGA
jgi:hypothetical protein